MTDDNVPAKQDWRDPIIKVLSDSTTTLSKLVVQLVQQQDNSHASFALTSASLAENILGERIKSKFRPLNADMNRRLFEGYGPISNISSRIDLAFAMSIIDQDMYRKARALNKLRVAFAHSLEIKSFAEPEIAALLLLIDPLMHQNSTRPSKVLINFVTELEKVTRPSAGY